MTQHSSFERVSLYEHVCL